MSIFPLWRHAPDINDEPGERDTIECERTVASVNKGLGIQAKLTNMAIFAAVLLVAGLMLWKYYAAVFEKRAEAKAAAAKDVKQTMASNLPPLIPPVFPEPTQADLSIAPPPRLSAPAGPGSSPPGSDGKPLLTPAQAALQRRLDSPLSFNTGGNAAGGGTMALSANGVVAGEPHALEASLVPGVGGDDPFAKSLQASRFSGAKAYLLPDPSFWLTQGAGIPCTVIPAIDTTLPGIVTCIQSADVYSTDHKVVLLERGTKWVGQQKFGMAQGQRRVGIVWSRGETPNHVLIDVDSAAGDALGRPGIDGVVDNHFWDRFGAAIMVSMISDVGSFLAASQQKGNGNTIVFPGTVQGAQNVMGEVLKSTINIPPTLTKNQGADIIIYLARDLDFRDVYALQEKR